MDLTTYQGSCQCWLDPTRSAVNVRCIDGVDVATLKVIPFDGKSWEAAAKAFIERRR